ncbi:DMT family transporter [Arenibaculum pallidiluteum]|uniref:DMT family transporter n=1 Tax=Arenibaculum pallidiluteum TaxID=2812559 RepID=UPI001A96D5CA|nr:DMT family transporter [Arenibaculum pallidiluteum]
MPSPLSTVRSAAATAPVAAALWMVLATSAFSVVNLLIQVAARDLHPFQIAFFRSAFGLAVMLPWVWRMGISGLRTEKLGLYATRSLTGVAAMLSSFLAVSLLPLAEAVALGFTQPLFTTIGAALVLGEVVRARRWTAVAVGFVGVLVILRPSTDAISWPALIMLVSAGFAAASALQVKALSRTEPAVAMVTYMSLLMTPMTLAPALFVWQWPEPGTWAVVVVLGAIASLGQIGISRAMALGEASQVMPIDYLKLPISALLGWLAFGQVVDAWSWLGAAVIAGSTLYVLHREALVARRARR